MTRQHPLAQGGFWRHPAYQAPRPLRSWLTGRGSLTARLQACYPAFHVQLLRSGFARPWPDECLPGSRRTIGFRRDVVLRGNNQACVFAHSFAPRAALRQGFHGLARQGSRPLGATLFANPRVKRSPLGFARLNRHHPLWQAAAHHLGALPPQLWARRSCFVLHGVSHDTGRKGTCLRVTEVFLPHHTGNLS